MKKNQKRLKKINFETSRGCCVGFTYLIIDAAFMHEIEFCEPPLSLSRALVRSFVVASTVSKKKHILVCSKKEQRAFFGRRCVSKKDQNKYNPPARILTGHRSGSPVMYVLVARFVHLSPGYSKRINSVSAKLRRGSSWLNSRHPKKKWTLRMLSNFVRRSPATDRYTHERMAKKKKAATINWDMATTSGASDSRTL
jgi:hypothetical protein